MKSWKLEDAKNQFSELVRRAMDHEPQRVTRNGRDAVVVLSADDYERLVAPSDLVQFLQQSPLARAFESGELTIERSRETDRDVDL